MVREHTPILGRDEQWARLDSTVHTSDGTGALLVVRGPSGSGKSALLDAASRNWLRHDVRVLSVSAAVPVPRMFDALLEAVRERVGDQREPELLEAVAAAARLRPTSESPTGEGPTRSTPLPLVHELTRALTRLARGKRTVLVIEDVDHVDRESVSALSSLAQGVRAVGGVVLATLGNASRGAHEQLVDLSDSVLDLPPLSDDDITALLPRWTGGQAAVDPTTTEALRTTLGPLFGNPATMRSLVRALRREDRLTVIDEHLCLRSSWEPIALPGDHELLRPVHECGPEGGRIVWCVAVLGELDVNDLPVLAEVADVELHACGRVLDRLVHDEVLREDNGRLRLSVPALGTALGREGARSSRPVHGALVRHMLDRRERGGAMDDSALAHHLVEAGPDFGGERGLEILLHEAGRTVETDPERAAERYRAAVHRMRASDRRLPRSLETMTRLQLSRGNFRELADDLGTVLPTLLETPRREGDSAGTGPYGHDDERMLAELAVCWFLVQLHEGHTVGIHDSTRLFDLMSTRDESTEQVRRLFSALFRGRTREAVTTLDTLVATFPAAWEKARPVIAFDEVLLLLQAMEGEHERFLRALSRWQQCHPAERDAPDIERLRDAGSMLDHATALELLLGHRPGSRGGGSAHAYQRVLRAYYAGEWDEALSVARSLEADRSHPRGSLALHLTRVVAAEICAARGHFRRAENWLARLPRRFACGHLLAWVRCGLRHRRGHTAEAVAEGWREYLHHRDRGSTAGLERLLERLIDYSVRLGDQEGAERMLEQLEAFETRHRTASAREAALLARGMVEADPTRLREGIESAKRRGDNHRVARGCAAMGRLLDEPRPWLHEGYDLVKQFGSSYGRGVFSELMRSRGIALTRSRGPREPLSSTENRIIDLVSDGYTNRQIAMAVQASEKTVESHLTKLFTRTGCRSRVELATARLEGRLMPT
ncbi:regulatory protein, luxR family [Actinopolyspora lacussalsi subsp. righensis]|uniref:Regulatory protein, luxR family n=1 Tax=Actinopolyspora righensis TaxID=995060 RepID=A0A1I6XAX9_9ACTN|nr:LuxR family transcriptional regulator [Actinopolyspora righensis]SFT35448.1 regulatory protein, luxR family [Actinopolyspora righensis]